MTTLPVTLSVTQTAALLGIGEAAVYEAAKGGDLPAVRIGKRILVLRFPLLERLNLPADYDVGQHINGERAS